MNFTKEREALVERLIKNAAQHRRLTFCIVICGWDNNEVSFHTGAKTPIFQRVVVRVTERIKKALQIKDEEFEGIIN